MGGTSMKSGQSETKPSGVRRLARAFSALRSFHPVLLLCVAHRLPLHVGHAIRPASAQRPDMVHDITRTRTRAPAIGRAGMAPLESFPHASITCPSIGWTGYHH